MKTKKFNIGKSGNSEDLYPTNNELQQTHMPVKDGFFVKPIGSYSRIKIPYKDILWVEAENNYSHIHLKQGNYVSVSCNIGKLEQFLPKDCFERSSRSEILNIYCVDKYDGNLVYLNGRNRFTVSQQYRISFFSRFTEVRK